MGKKTQSGSMHGEKFWDQEQNNVGKKMMESMGWEKGTGIGKEGTGIQNAIKASKKADRVGIGATDTSDGMYYSAMNDVYNNLLAKLNSKKNAGATTYVAGCRLTNSAPAEGEEAPAAPAQESMSASIKKAATKRLLYSKFVNAKNVGGYSDEQKAAIFGTAGKKEGKVQKQEEEEEEDSVVKNSKISMADYFKQKMAGYHSKMGGVAAPRRSPRLSAASPGDSMASMAGIGGLGLGSQAADEPAEDEVSENKKKKRKQEDTEASGDDDATEENKKKKKKKKTDEAGGSKEHQKLIKKLLKATEKKKMKQKKLEKAFVAEAMEKDEELTKKNAKAAFSATVSGWDGVSVEGEFVLLA